MLTGTGPNEHGIVGNGWHERSTAETRFWLQSNRLVAGQKVWDRLRAADPSITTANCFWWFAMHADVDVSVTPRPMYPADGRKLPDVWTRPASLRDEIQSAFGQFPLFHFWGPTADITSSRWIADVARRVAETFDPTLLLAYLPHLDYGLQKFGPDDPRMKAERRAIDDVAADLIESMIADDRRVLLVNEYGIMPVADAVAPNRYLRDHGMISIRMERGTELLDAGESEAFAVPDHQIAHVYVRDPRRIEDVASMLAALDGVAEILAGPSLRDANLSHARAGDIVLVAKRDRWFCHDWWIDDSKAPDFQRTVDIHRKPGYDPRELFVDPALRWPKATIGLKLLRKRMGFRGLLDVVPTDTTLVRGSHGRTDAALDPLVWCSEPVPMPTHMPMREVSSLIESLVLGTAWVSATEAS